MDLNELGNKFLDIFVKCGKHITANLSAYLMFLLILFGMALGALLRRAFEPIRAAKDVRVDTVFVQQQVEARQLIQVPVPDHTAFRVSDIVCAWTRWEGVVTRVEWSKGDPTVLVYKVQQWDDEEGWLENYYYETELAHGKCN